MREIVLIFRKPFDSSYSVIYLFEELLVAFSLKRASVLKYQVPFYSKGFLRRVANTITLTCFPNKIVHITGDIHYVILGAWFSKRILTVHDLSFLYRTSGMNYLLLKLFWVKLPCLFSHKVTVISHATKQDLLKYVKLPESKVEVVYDFVDEIFQPAERHFNKDNPKILQVGTAFNKNIDRLIEALEGLSCELLIIGRLSARQISLLEKSDINYQNLFDIPLEAIHQKYLEADLLCYTSTIEGFGMPIIEAQATGLPVVTSNCSSMPEIAGDAAIFVNPYCVNSIRGGILEIIYKRETRDLLVRKGYVNVKRFSKERIASAYLNIYDSL